MKIALVHDYLSQDGGAERVLEAFHQIWPEAPIFTLFYDREKVDRFAKADVRESFLAKFPFIKEKYQWYLPLMPLAHESHNLDEFDVVLSSTSAFAKGVITQSNTIHISYCHTPTRYLWTDTHSYISDLKYNKLIKLALPKLLHRLRMWDKMSVSRVDYFIANSLTVKQRIKKYYNRKSPVIYPPVNTNNFFVSKDVGDYFVSGGRLVSYKRFDIIVQTFNRLGWPIKIFGEGPELEVLKSKAKKNIDFLGRVSEEEKSEILSRALAFIHPQIEDLGITPIEAMACGRPVVALRVGGARETVIEGKTGLFFDEQNWESLLHTLLNFHKTNWDGSEIKNHAENFNFYRFKGQIKNFVESAWTKKISEENNSNETFLMEKNFSQLFG